MSFNETKLVCGMAYGTNAKDIYLQCCQWFGWDTSLAKEFGMMKPLYGHKAADNATKDVWFICHSNLNNDILIKDEKGELHHRNYIHVDGNGRVYAIDEYQQNAPLDDIAYPLRDRITFAKIKGKYVYVGIYKSTDPNSKKPARKLIRVGDIYPMERTHNE